jgi:hypothetical protein
MAPWTIRFLIVGVGAIVNGIRQRRKGEAGTAKLVTDESKIPESSFQKGRY